MTEFLEKIQIQLYLYRGI